MKMSFRKKMIFSLLPALIIAFTALGFSIYSSSYGQLETIGRVNIKQLTEQYAQRVSDEFEVFFTISDNYNKSMQDYKKIDVNQRRSHYFNLTRQTLNYNENVLACWCDFDKDSLDGQDARYTNTNIYPSTGRFNVSFHRGTGDIIMETAELDDGELEEDYYTLPRILGRSIVSEPYKYSYTDNPADEILMTTISSPVFNSNKQAIGVSAIDVPLEKLVEFTNSIKPFENCYATLISPNGLYLAHKDTTLLGKSITANTNFSKELADDILKNITECKEFNIDFIGNINNERELIYYEPVTIGSTDTKMMFAISMPFDVLTKEADAMLFQVIIYFSIALVLTGIMILLVASWISNPLRKLNVEFGKLAKGDLSMDVTVKSNDEAGELARAAMLVTDTIKSLVEDIENIANAAGDGDLKLRVNDKDYEGTFKELGLSINSMLEKYRYSNKCNWRAFETHSVR